MERIPFSSSNIVSAGYDPEQEILEVEFKGGVIWQYTHFPEYMWNEFLGAPSQGKYFLSQIRPRFNDLGYRIQ